MRKVIDTSFVDRWWMSNNYFARWCIFLWVIWALMDTFWDLMKWIVRMFS